MQSFIPMHIENLKIFRDLVGSMVLAFSNRAKVVYGV